MTKAIPRFKHRSVGPRKGTGAIIPNTIEPSRKKHRARGLEKADYKEIGTRIKIKLTEDK